MQIESGQIVGQYTVEERLGEGGMAVVYRARHNQLGTEHALKVLTIRSEAIRERLLQEGRVQAGLRHPNIVCVTDVVMMGDSPGLVMEYIAGPSLEEFLAKGRLTLPQVDALAQGILQGVATAHRKDLIHRDLKPANILLEVIGGRITPKVADFGLAKILDQDLQLGKTRSGVAMGTPRYMSPEQTRDAKSVDRRTDVFALGAILYEMICGVHAFPGDDLLALFNAVAQGDYIPPRNHCPELSSHMERAIVGALAPDRDQRIPSVDHLLATWRGEVLAPSDPSLESTNLWTEDHLVGQRPEGGSIPLPSNPTMDPPRESHTWSGDSIVVPEEAGDDDGATPPFAIPEEKQASSIGEPPPDTLTPPDSIPPLDASAALVAASAAKGGMPSWGIPAAIVVVGVFAVVLLRPSGDSGVPKEAVVAQVEPVEEAEVPEAEAEVLEEAEAGGEPPVGERAGTGAQEGPARPYEVEAGTGTGLSAEGVATPAAEPVAAEPDPGEKDVGAVVDLEAPIPPPLPPPPTAVSSSGGAPIGSPSTPSRRGNLGAAFTQVGRSFKQSAREVGGAARVAGGEIKAVATEIRAESTAAAGPAPALVRVRGDKATVTLKSPSRDYRSEENLPPGTYTVSPVFKDGTRGRETRIKLAAGQSRTLVCSREKLVCE
jgi:serine/threonine-protein kinase